MRARRTPCSALATALLLVGMVGCAAFNDQQDSLIRIKSNRNPVKAQRLTLAGVNALENGQRDYASEKLLSAIRADSGYGPAHNNLGLLQFDDGKLYQAVLSFERAMELMPADPVVYYNLGLALEKADRKNQALELYWQAVEIDPTEPHFLGNLVRLRRRLGEDGPDVIAQLQDLMLIETRPPWRDWASEQLNLVLNPNLDRGPETPNFSGKDSEDESPASRNQSDPQTRIIDLSPGKGNLKPSKASEQAEETPELLPPATLESRDSNSLIPKNQGAIQQATEPASILSSKPIPIRSEGAFNTLPESITDTQDASTSDPSED
jgi:tetratricopeptide (TPR) repeat protein